MGKTKVTSGSFSQLTKAGLRATRKKLIAETKRKKSYLVVAGTNGKARRLHANVLK